MTDRRNFLKQASGVALGSVAGTSIPAMASTEYPDHKTLLNDHKLVRAAIALGEQGLKYQIVSDNLILLYSKRYENLITTHDCFNETKKCLEEIHQRYGLFNIHIILLSYDWQATIDYRNQKIIMELPENNSWHYDYLKQLVQIKMEHLKEWQIAFRCDKRKRDTTPYKDTGESGQEWIAELILKERECDI